MFFQTAEVFPIFFYANLHGFFLSLCHLHNLWILSADSSGVLIIVVIYRYDSYNEREVEESSSGHTAAESSREDNPYW